MTDRPDREQPQPLGYEPTPKRREGRGFVPILCIVAGVYGIAGFIVVQYPSQTIEILVMASIIAAPIAGFYFGTQNKDFWT